MIKNSVFRSSDFGLRALGCQPHTIVAWNAILDATEAYGLKLIEFQPLGITSTQWSIFIKSKLEIDLAKPLESIDRVFKNQLNEDLKKAFIGSEELVTKYWDKMSSVIDFAGFYIPICDINRVNPSTLESHIIFQNLHLKYFQYNKFIKSIAKFNQVETGERLKFSDAVWIYVYEYARFLYRLKKDSAEIYKRFGKWYSERLDLNDFHRRLPSEQLIILLLIKCEAVVSDDKEKWKSQHIFSKGSDSVISFFERYTTDLDLLYGQSETGLDLDLVSISGVRVMDEFEAVFLKDRDELLIQEVMDNSSGLGLHNSLPLLLQMKYGPNSIYNVSSIIKDKIFDSGDGPLALFKDDEQLPKCRPTTKNIYLENVQYWYDLMPSDRSQILSLIHQNTSSQLLNDVYAVVESRCRTHLLNSISFITAPILEWRYERDVLFPQWNIFDKGHGRSLKAIYRLSAKEIEDERILLEKHLEDISNFDYQYELDGYLSNSNPVFRFEEFQQKWEQVLNRLTIRISRKQKYYDSRMREFGIYDSDSDQDQVDKYIWLREMLLIEEEVKPYIRFVKQAFQTALPIRNKVSFSQDRHESDGVEFDPDTLFDQEKWIRADVMKVMESRVEIGEATQINTFCLDYSGSMNHDRMRNLFKILCLLVLGLEDRKSHDAFHFFGNHFIEVVNFSNEFTNRRVLFRILQQISDLHSGKIHFSGNGATNISDGIGKSHDKMKEFVQQYKTAYPMANVVTSIFVITDGEPTVGITEIPLLHEFVESKREDGDVSIKGIYIKSEDDLSPFFMKKIFGKSNYVETSDFEEGVKSFVQLLTETYKKQRKDFKWKQKKQKLGLTK